MGRAATRQAIVDYYRRAEIPFLDQIFAARPIRIDLGQRVSRNYQTTCAAVVHIARELEQRIAIGGDPGPTSGGTWRVDYYVEMELEFHSVHDSMESMMFDVDTCIDAFKAVMRADRQFGQPPMGPIWQQGQQNVDFEYGQPYDEGDGAGWYLRVCAHFCVTEMVLS